MSIFSNIKYYVNYFYFNRGETEIKNYFSSNEINQAIKELIEEGYTQFMSKFIELINQYTLIYPLNRQETIFIEAIKGKCFSNIKHEINYSYFESEVRAVKNNIVSYKKERKSLNNEYQLRIKQYQIKALRDSLKQIWPISEAVISRRFCKKLLEELIRDNITSISLNNYTPDIQILKNYLASVSSNYIFREGFNEDLALKLKNIIADLEKKQKSENIKVNKKKDILILIYKDENNTQIKLIKSLMKLKNECNKIVHFNKEYEDNLDIQNYIYDELQIKEEEEKEIENSIGTKETITKSNAEKNKEKKILISDVAKFLAYGHPSQQLLKKLEEFSKKISQGIKAIQDKVNSLLQDDEINDDNYYYNIIIELENRIDTELSNLVLKDYNLSLSNIQISTLNRYFKENILNVDDIKINDIEHNDDNLVFINGINYFNNRRKNMNIKEKLKFNITFEENINLINIKKKIETIKPNFQTIKEINDEINRFNINYEKEMAILKREIDNINISIKFIKREEIFTSITQEEFIEALESNYNKKNINYFSSEINNFYLYIYLLKNKLYDEKSYKLSVRINEDYI